MCFFIVFQFLHFYSVKLSNTNRKTQHNTNYILNMSLNDIEDEESLNKQ